MTEKELRAEPAFEKFPIVSEEESDKLHSPNDPSKFDGSIADVAEAEELATFLSDPNFVPKGAVRYEDGSVHAIFWKKRTDV